MELNGGSVATDSEEKIEKGKIEKMRREKEPESWQKFEKKIEEKLYN